jgi:hypothetical protein
LYRYTVNNNFSYKQSSIKGWLVAQPGLVAQFCNPSYWEARTWDGLRSTGPQHRGLGLERLAKEKELPWSCPSTLKVLASVPGMGGVLTDQYSQTMFSILYTN